MSSINLSTNFSRHTLALAVVLAAGASFMSAQTTSVQTASVQTAGTQTADATPHSTIATAAAPVTLNLDLPKDTQAEPMFSSSADQNEVAVNTRPFDFMNAMQYGGGRSGRPRYRGGNQNADGSNKWTAMAGVGFTAPVQDTQNYLTTGYSFQGGFGRQWSKKFAALVQFDWDNFGFTNSALANQLTIYNFELQGTGTTLSSVGGHSHVWSFTIDPTYTFFQGQSVGAYVVGGVGFYHKVATFTTPSSGCDPYYYYYYGVCIEESTNATIDHYTSNAPGFDGGFGLTYKFSRFSSERFYGEVRYVYVANSQRSGVTAGTITSANVNDPNDYPANSDKTYYFPVKFGIRF
jgi:hypothetical protein